MTLYCQPANAEGDLVARGHYSANLEWPEAYSIVMPRLYHTLSHAFASHFDLDQAWMAHLRTYHRPQDGSDIPQQTAVEAGVVPEFRR